MSRPAIVGLACVLAVLGANSSATQITEARYAAPVDRYGHFAAGRPHEYAQLAVLTSAGRTVTLQLPEDQVFEDVAPRLVKLAADEPLEVLAVVSQRGIGARLVLIRLQEQRLAIHAQSAAIGTPMRWMNPVGVADLDGDGRAEVAAVVTPHIGGTLKIYRQSRHELIETAALGDFSNHMYGSPELGLSMPVSIDGRSRLLIPDATRQHLRLIALQQNRLVEVGRCALDAPVAGAISQLSTYQFAVTTSSGRTLINLDNCTK